MASGWVALVGRLIVLVSSSVLTWVGHTNKRCGPVISSCAVSLIASLVTPGFSQAAMCGTFVGMSSNAVIKNLWWVLLAGTITTVFYETLIELQRVAYGLGGRLGFMSFIGVNLAVLLERIINHQDIPEETGNPEEDEEPHVELEAPSTDSSPASPTTHAPAPATPLSLSANVSSIHIPEDREETPGHACAEVTCEECQRQTCTPAHAHALAVAHSGFGEKWAQRSGFGEGGDDGGEEYGDGVDGGGGAVGGGDGDDEGGYGRGVKWGVRRNRSAWERMRRRIRRRIVSREKWADVLTAAYRASLPQLPTTVGFAALGSMAILLLRHTNPGGAVDDAVRAAAVIGTLGSLAADGRLWDDFSALCIYTGTFAGMSTEAVLNDNAPWLTLYESPRSTPALLTALATYVFAGALSGVILAAILGLGWWPGGWGGKVGTCSFVGVLITRGLIAMAAALAAAA